MGLPPRASRRQTCGAKMLSWELRSWRSKSTRRSLLQLSTHSACQESPLYSRLDHEFPKTCVRKLFLRTLNTRSIFILLQVLDLLTTLAAFRAGGFEVNPLVATLTIHFGRVGGVVLSKMIAVLLMLGVRRRLWMVNLFYISVIGWNVVVVVSLVLRRH